MAASNKDGWAYKETAAERDRVGNGCAVTDLVEIDLHHGDAAWAAVPWSSTGYHENGEAFDRPGRATATYVRENGKWLATHTHFSLKPGTPPHTFGKK